MSRHAFLRAAVQAERRRLSGRWMASMFGELKAYPRRTCMLPKHAPLLTAHPVLPRTESAKLSKQPCACVMESAATVRAVIMATAPEEPVPSRKQLHRSPNHRTTNYRHGTFLIHRHTSNTSGLCLGTTARETNHPPLSIAPHSAPISAFVLARLPVRPDSGSSYTELSFVGGR